MRFRRPRVEVPYVLGAGWRGNCVVNICRERFPDAPYPKSFEEELAQECYLANPPEDGVGGYCVPYISHSGPHQNRNGDIWPAVSWQIPCYAE